MTQYPNARIAARITIGSASPSLWLMSRSLGFTIAGAAVRRADVRAAAATGVELEPPLAEAEPTSGVPELPDPTGIGAVVVVVVLVVVLVVVVVVDVEVVVGGDGGPGKSTNPGGSVSWPGPVA